MDTYNFFGKKGVTVFVTTKNIKEAEFCNRVSFIQNGEIILTGTPIEIKRKMCAKDMENAFKNLIKNSNKIPR